MSEPSELAVKCSEEVFMSPTVRAHSLQGKQIQAAAAIIQRALDTRVAELEKEHDEEIGDFQNDVRDKVIQWTGATDDRIDGKGSDAGWQEFTLAEISQGIAFLKDKHESELTTSKAREEKLREALIKEREALASFLVPHRRGLAECWLKHFEECGSVYFDGVGFVYPMPLQQALKRTHENT